MSHPLPMKRSRSDSAGRSVVTAAEASSDAALTPPARVSSCSASTASGAGAGAGAGSGSGGKATSPTHKAWVATPARKGYTEVVRAMTSKIQTVPRSRVPFRVITCDTEECIPGPKTRIIAARQVSTRSSQMIFCERPRNVLIIKKWRDAKVTKAMVELGTYIKEELDLNVWVQAEEDLPQFYKFEDLDTILLIDLVVCMGGDGTVLHAASQFPEAVPPMLPVAMGSLGFMTPFDVGAAKAMLKTIVGGYKTHPIDLSIRVRMQVDIYRRGSTEVFKSITALNEVCIDRGSSHMMAMLEAYVDGTHLTTVQADGIIVATPTGSTAYNLSAGGPMLLPTVPALCFTPVCPHSLSFRPLLIPDSATITIVVPEDARATCSASCDGRNQVELQRGDKVVINVSDWPLPVVAMQFATADWIKAIKHQLLWNVRDVRQKHSAATSAL